ncbi:MAG: nucleotidyltransferase [Cytophagaceae bacterium]|nr:nucleotidyltransferase [Cytophagaceae bacterium]
MDIFEPVFVDFIKLLNKHEVEYILIGGMAVNVYGYSRPTGDMDIWINPINENGQKLIKAISEYGYNTEELEYKNFEETDVFFLGRAPFRIDILNKMQGLKFADCFTRINKYEIEGGIFVSVLHINDLIVNKILSGRHKDLDDIEKLKRQLD